eukprot:TRINITY_DN13286_c0_g2_i1.p1 TRINITY_DN13286_c0_g2~~TRINITY_DN13286_c0_g2_i1.p1  ORF type:complete len:174 (+),score=22.84 TRINITY_DN13286_c0_g2_i1:646-1167(+)
MKCEDGTYRVSDGNHFFIGVGNSSSADGWCQLKLSDNTQIRETHQYKYLRDGTLNDTTFASERKKAANPQDLFIMFSVYNETLSLPPLSGLVCQRNYQEYYGPFAGRVFWLTQYSQIFSINTAKRSQLEMIPGIGERRATLIIDHRPFKNLKDCVERTGISPKYLTSFYFDKK